MRVFAFLGWLLRLVMPAASGLLMVACDSEARGERPVGQAADAQAAEVAPALTPTEFAVLNRLTWGASPADVAAFKRLGRQGWIDDQLRDDDSLRMPDFARRMHDEMDGDGRPFEQQLVELQRVRMRISKSKRDPSINVAYTDYSEPIAKMRAATVNRSLLRDLYSQDQLREQMTWFWSNHFNVWMSGGTAGAAGGDYVEKVIRPRVFGHFCDLVGATLRHPAMLAYLDNARNTVRRGNENYARELMELHTLGVGAGYSQKDVQALARVLSGAGLDLDHWPVPPAPEGGERRGLYVFDPAQHDFGAKTLLGAPIRARGPGEIDEATQRLCRHPATARRVATRLAQFLVAEVPPEPLVTRMAETFTRTDGDIEQVLRTMLGSAEFEASLGGLFKDPSHFMLSALRMGFADRPVTNLDTLMRELSRLGHGRFYRTTPDGYPLEAAAWNASGQMATRFDHAAMIGVGWRRLFAAPVEGTSAAQASLPPNKAPDLQGVRRTYGFYASLSPETASVLAEARSPGEWNGYFLASPEFMRR